MVTEQIHRYPRWISWPIELLSTCGVVAALAIVARDLLRYLWFRNGGADTTFFKTVPYLPELYTAIYGVRGTSRPLVTEATQLIGPLAWLALALFAALLLRNSLPTVRTSPRGMLIEFAGGWLPIPWESLVTIKVTEDLSAERFVLLAETTNSYLTGWHRFYSFFYRFGFGRGFLIISAINDFDGLIKTLLSESDRVARVLENAKPARLQEDASSPLFRFLLGPASFFSRRTNAEVNVPTGGVAAGGPAVRGAYPSRIVRLLTWSAGVLAVLTAIHYVVYWLKFLVLTFPTLARYSIFSRLTVLDLNRAAPWWLLVAAHLMLLLMLGVIFVLRNVLPELETRPNGLAVRYFSRWVLVPWSNITAIKVTEFSEESQIVLVQSKGGMPFAARISSLLYDGSFTPGVLITSAMSNFEPLLQRIVLEISRYQGEQASDNDSPIFQNEARSLFLQLTFRAATVIDNLVETIREDETSKDLNVFRLMQASKPMFWLALPIALLMFFERSISQAILPDTRLFLGMVVLFLLSLLEWPLVSLLSVLIDEVSDGGEEGNRAFYLYSATQLPRLIPLFGALVMVLVGVPFLPILLWLVAIAWSFLLAAGLWEALYDWHGTQLLAGGLIPVTFQLLILLAYVLVLR
jgi:hypothetical protein